MSKTTIQTVQTAQTTTQTTQAANDFLQGIFLAAKKKQTPQQKKAPKKAAADLNIFFQTVPQTDNGRSTSNDKREKSGVKAQPTPVTAPTKESAEMNALIAKALAVRKAAQQKQDIAERLMEQNKPDTTVSTTASTTPSPTTFLSAESFSRPKAKEGKQKVAAYIRVSTDMNDQENSYETQEKYFHRLLEQNAEWVSAGVYSDYGISGTSHEKRTGFKRILRHCREGKIDRIICKSISRFARNTKDFMEALNVLNASDVTILFEKEGLDTADPTSNFILTTLAAIAQEESRSVSSNIRWGNEKRFPRGDVPNYDVYGYRFTKEKITTESGYCYRAVEIVPEEAEVVRWVFEQVAEGMSYKDIARDLNRRRIPRKASAYTRRRMENSAKGQLNGDIDEGWTSSQISNMVRNERYTGDVLVQKTYTEDYLTHKVRVNKGEVAQYLVKDHHPAIISRELFEEVKKLWGMGTPAKGNRTPHAFSGRLICGCCGRFYNVRNAQSHPIWFCPSTTRNNGKHLCGNEKVYEEQIVRMFRKAVSERFHLVNGPVIDDINVADIMSGRYEGQASLTDSASAFVSQMLARLENIQRMDFIERDRAFMKRQMLAANAAVEGAGKRVRLLKTQKDTMEVRRELLGDSSITDAQIAVLNDKITAESAKLEAAEEEAKKISDRLEYLEGYWEELEADHERRDKAIEWMKSLPSGKEGTVEFLNGMTDTYVKAFVLSVTIHDPLHYTIHWFDDTKTEVEMYSNIEGYQNTADYFDGQRMRSKYRKKM